LRETIAALNDPGGSTNEQIPGALQIGPTGAKFLVGCRALQMK
jgi:hypothetical protein